MSGISVPRLSGSSAIPRRLIVATLLLAVAIGLCWQALANSGQPTRAVAWGSASFTVYAISLLCVVGGGRGKALGLDQWRLGSWIVLWYGTAFGLATITWVQPQIGTPAQISLPNVLRALWLVAVGMTMWAFGYFAGPGRAARYFGLKKMTALSLRFSPEVRSPLTPWILYGIGTTARVASLLTTGLFGYIGDVQSAVTTASSYQQLLTILSFCAPLAVAAAALQVYRERIPGARFTLTALFLIEIVIGAAEGNKQNFIITIIAVAVPFSVARRRLHWGLLIFTVLVFLLIVIPFNQAYRGVARGASGTLSASQALAAAPGVLAQTISTGNVAGKLSSSTSYLLTRIREIDNPAIIIQRTPGQIEFASPMQLIEGPIVTLVPRAVWPGKPILDSGYEFSQNYYDLPATEYTSSAITPVGDLYRHGGWIPVIAGMFLLGCGTRFLDDVMDVRGNPYSVFLFILIFPSFVNQENDWVGMLASLPGTLLVWLLAIKLTFRKTRIAAQQLDLFHEISS